MSRSAGSSPAIERARRSLDGLSIGDAFGERFFGNPAVVETMVEERVLPAGPWRWTDDTDMAIAIVRELERAGQIDSSALALEFGRRYRRSPHRGYGAGAQETLQKINVGIPWEEASSEAFGGSGSMGNGAAMRAAPLGAFFADAMDEELVRNATASAVVTHFHRDGQAGAIAVAAAAAFFWRTRGATFGVTTFFDEVERITPAGPTRDALAEARRLPAATPPRKAAAVLGSGQRVMSCDTVPFALWCAGCEPSRYDEALWRTVAGFGDRDTTCAIVGGIVALRASPETIPNEWRRAREPLDL